MNDSRGALDRTTYSVAALLAGLAFLLYYLTAARDIVVGDTPEFITAAAILGVPHPPGYPLFTMLGHLFSLLPLGPIPFRVNLVSVTCGALTVGVIFLTARRLGRDRLAAVLAAIFLAVTPVFWRWSLVAEVFALHSLLASLVIYFLVVWRAQPERTSGLVLAAFVSGLACTHHQTIVLLGPAILFLLWEQRAILLARPRVVLLCVLVFVVGLLPYAYIPWAAAGQPAYSWGDVATFRDLLKLVARRSYGTLNLVSVSGYTGGPPWGRLAAFGISWDFVTGLLAFAGALQAFRKQRWYFWFVLLGFVWVGPFFVWITNLNLTTAPMAMFVLERFFIFGHVVTAPLVALGFLFIGELFPARRVLAGAALLVAMVSLVLHYPFQDESDNHVARRFTDDVFASVEPGTILFVSGDAMTLPLVYEHVVEKKRPDVALVVIPLLRGDWYLRQLKRRYQDLTVPFDHFDGEKVDLKTLVDANPARPKAIIGNAPELSRLDADYRPVPRGLVIVITPKSERLLLAEVVSAHERIERTFRPPSPREVRAWTFEQDLANSYALADCRIGRQYEEVGDKAEARRWYRRAHDLSPDLRLVQEALARVEP